MARDNGAAVRSEPRLAARAFNELLTQQLSTARQTGELDLDALLEAVSAHYDRVDAERRGVVRAMQLMSEEAQALTREIREETASHLQAILDNVKDAIVTLDATGHIESFNPTAERVFGYAAADVLGRTLDYLLPDCGSSQGELLEFLERGAAKIDDTHVDLAAHRASGRCRDGTRVAVEVAVSKARLNGGVGFIVCIRDSMERQAAEQSLRDSEAKFRGLFESVMDGVYCSTRDGRLLVVNPALVQMLGYASAQELYAVPAASLYWYPSDRDTYVRRMEADGEVRNDESVLRRKDGTMLVVVDNGRVVRDKEGRIEGFEGTIADITERKKAETAVFQAKERAEVTLRSIGDAVITTDSQGRIDYMNPVAESLIGWENREAQGQLIGAVLTVVDESTRETCESPVVRCLREGQVLGLAQHTVLVNRRGQEIAIQDSAAPIRDRAGNLIGAVMVFHDVSKERRLHRALHYQASHDALTGLINRREFENRLTAAVENVRQDAAARHALLYLDLDQFKVVNDTCGHPAGDLLLKQITGVLQSRVRAGDSLARLGGDEFGILLQACTLEQAMRLAEGVRQAIRDYRFNWHDDVLAVGVSIGIVEITPETPTVANVMSAADVACYTAKDQGRDRVQLYTPDNVPERHREMHWVSKLTRAFDESRFELVYQPIVQIGSVRREPEHFELMLRLRDDTGTLIAPAEFIPAAERYNVMPAIDRWVVRQALDVFVHRQSTGVPPYTIAVNLSGTSLNDERFLEYLISELGSSNLAPGALCFEITETAAIANLNNVVHFMRELKTRGCHFALDDFGSGLSSFLYLKTLPVDYLKIDGQFIENVARDPVDRSMVEAISQVGRAMGIHTIAERVESAEVLTELGRLGIGFAQGFFLAAPRPAHDFPYLRDKGRAAPAR